MKIKIGKGIAKGAGRIKYLSREVSIPLPRAKYSMSMKELALKIARELGIKDGYIKLVRLVCSYEGMGLKPLSK